MKLTHQVAKNSFIREKEEVVKAKYLNVKGASKGGKKTANFSDPKNTFITQVEIAKGSSKKDSKSGENGMGIKKASEPEEFMKSAKAPSFSKKAGEFPTPPSAKRTSNSMKSPSSNVKAELAKEAPNHKLKIPSAKMASEYTDAMPHGSSNMKIKSNKSEMSKPSYKTEKKREGKIKTVQAKGLGTLPNKKSVSQLTGPSKKEPSGDGAMSTPTWQKVKGADVRESLQLVVNGQNKSSFGIVHRNIIESLAKRYENYGYDVEIVKSKVPAAWKKDKIFRKLLNETVEAEINNAQETYKKNKKKALNRIFSVHKNDYNTLYENKQHFLRTIQAAFERILENAEIQYRNKLDIFEGIARIKEGRNTEVDIQLVTQAINEKNALQNFINEIHENYGFKTKIKHIFVDGKKYDPLNANKENYSKKPKLIENEFEDEYVMEEGDDEENPEDDILNGFDPEEYSDQNDNSILNDLSPFEGLEIEDRF